jgi:hypothetical protein
MLNHLSAAPGLIIFPNISISFNGLEDYKVNMEIIIGTASYGWHANKKYRWMHDPGFENIETTIGLLQQYLKNNKARIKIDGYAIFRYGTTEPSEWVYLKYQKLHERK